MLGVLEPLLEQTVFEDVPANLAAIKQRVESIQVPMGWGDGEAGSGMSGAECWPACEGSREGREWCNTLAELPLDSPCL